VTSQGTPKPLPLPPPTFTVELQYDTISTEVEHKTQAEVIRMVKQWKADSPMSKLVVTREP
jgi:hypothetical protein